MTMERSGIGSTLDRLVVRLSDDVTIIRGDCRDVLPVECDAIVTDPPYGINWRPRVNHQNDGWTDNVESEALT